MTANDWNRDALERLRRAVLSLDMCEYLWCGYVIYDADEYDKHLRTTHPDEEVPR